MSRPLEHCCKCDAPPGRAGKGEDSLYTESDEGPFCEDCFPARAIEAEVRAEAQPVTLWQYRTFFEENTSTPGWSDWEDVRPRNPRMDSVEDRVSELDGYISKGYKYELRALYTTPQPPAPCPYCDDTGDVHSPDGEWRGECNCGAEKYAQLQRENDALQAKVTELSDLSVTHIMLDVVPGADGMGEEIYAKSVADVERVLSAIGERNEGLTSKVAEQSAEIERLVKGLSAVESLIDESTGVTGLHLNGDIALWKSIRTGGFFESWLVEFDEALEAIAAHRGQP